MRIFGFEIVPQGEEDSDSVQSVVSPANDDGAIVVQAPTTGLYVDLDATYRSELDLIHKYRQMAMQPEVENAISDIVDEAIVHDSDDGVIVKMNLDRLDVKDNIKELINEEFETVLGLLDFNNFGDEIFRKWYTDGRLHYNLIIDNENPRAGIHTLVYIDSRKIKKVREVTKEKTIEGAEIVTGVQEYYVYNDKLLMNNPNSGNPLWQSSVADGGMRLSKDSVVQVVSGLYDPIKGSVLSYLHKAIRPTNQLRFVEDATVIYRVSRAPERRVFYVNVDGMSKIKAEQYLKNIMTNFRNKLSYDPTTGEIKDDRRHLAMLEDFWMPRTGDGKSTEITTLPAGQNLGQMEDVLYFQKLLYKALNIPSSRIENPTGVFNLGQPGVISRDEIKFSKFIHHLRAKFHGLFTELMERQLSLKGICTVEEWNDFKKSIYYDWSEDNNFAELKDTEMLTARLNTLNVIGPWMGVFFSKKWVWKNVVRMDDEEIKEVTKQMAAERVEADEGAHPPLAGYPPVVPPGAPVPMEDGPMSVANAPAADTPVGKKKVPDNLDAQAKAFLNK